MNLDERAADKAAYLDARASWEAGTGGMAYMRFPEYGEWDEKNPEYRAWCEDVFYLNCPRACYVAPTFLEWLNGDRNGRVVITTGMIGREGPELAYTLASWRLCEPPRQKEAEEARAAFVGGAFRTLWLYSPGPGTTKTGLAVVTAPEHRWLGRTEIFRMPRLSVLKIDQQERVLEDMARCKCVVLDDIHRYRFSNAVNSDFFHSIADTLCSRNVAVIVTANATVRAMAAAYPDSEAAFDRFNQGGLYECSMDGHSRRT